MRFDCIHTFSIEAEDPEQFETTLRSYHEKVRKASQRLDIGYGYSLMWGRPAIDRWDIANGKKEEPETPLERLFE